MKKLSLVLVIAIMMAVVISCSKKQDDVIAPQKQYASFVAGEIIPQFGDIVTLKSASVGVTNFMYMYKDNGGTYTKVDGTEFLPGSAPYVFWSTAGNNPGSFGINQTVYSNYTPAEPIRVVIEQRNVEGKVAFLGIKDLNPTFNSFPLNLVCRRLGDKLTINTNALTILPGYATMSFKVSFGVQPIDVLATELDPINSNTDNGWPFLHLGTSVLTETSLTRTQIGVQSLYDDVEGKITGTIYVTIYVDNATIVKTVPASELGHGLALTLSTTRVGGYDSQNMGVTQQDIVVNAVDIPVNSN